MPPSEQEDIAARFAAELAKPTGDGKNKRDRGEKPPWYADTHEAQVFNHIAKWKRGELVDPDSGAHPLAHAAWRCLAIACIETGNTPVAQVGTRVSYESSDGVLTGTVTKVWPMDDEYIPGWVSVRMDDEATSLNYPPDEIRVGGE